ncbi:hypothetical protein NP493_472g02008 [Ridgeia piscesae]|uniref:DDE-1 domain-containing protein n=1 Tax=Ridgeia piscesae TaxID=27915 RepID=A0AAD9KYP5_RIDPI|nr:hypothetical protein NP493_472g02008 [Ridgeia piscesae]
MDAIVWLKSAWDILQASTIQKCFKRCGFQVDTEVASDVEQPSLHLDQPSLEPELQTVIGEVSLQTFADMDDEATSRASTGDSEPVLPEPDISEDIDEEEDVPAVISRRTAMAHVDSLVAFGLSRQNPELECLEKCSRQTGLAEFFSARDTA